MAEWTIDRTINLDETKTKKLVNILIDNKESKDKDIEKLMIENGIVTPSYEYGFLNRRWYTYLRSYGLYDDDVTEMGKYYSKGILSLHEFATLHLIKRSHNIIDNIYISPFKIVLGVFDKLIDEYDISNAYLTPNEFSSILVKAQDDSNDTIKNIVSDIINNREYNIDLQKEKGQHADIYFNLLVKTKIFEKINSNLYLNINKIRFFKYILKFFDINCDDQVEDITLINGSFIDYIESIEFRNINNSNKNNKNDDELCGKILYEYLFKGSLHRIEDELQKKLRKKNSSIDCELEKYGIFKDDEYINKGIYSDFLEYPGIIIAKLLCKEDDRSKNIAIRLLEFINKNERKYEGQSKDEIIEEIQIEDYENIFTSRIKEISKYDKDDILKNIFIDKEKIDNIIFNLDYKKNIILQGPPGVGKTFVAKSICYIHQGKITAGNIEMVQFHQSYSYEDFIRGYRPNKDGGFELKDGVFYKFTQKAISDPNNNYYFIIDEINRGNLSKIFGELMMLIDKDKRGEDYQVSLTYQESDEQFYIPKNLYIIGTMNTADRSIAMVDYALRRRFGFIDIEPAFNNNTLKEYFIKYLGNEMTNKIINRITLLNKEIEKDSLDLGKGYRIGHSYFTPTERIDDIDCWYERIIKMEIEPLIREYWFDKNEEELLQKVDDLLEA